MTSLGIKFWLLNVQSLEKFNHQKSFTQLHTLAGKDNLGFLEIFRMVLNQKQQQLVWTMFKLLFNSVHQNLMKTQQLINKSLDY